MKGKSFNPIYINRHLCTYILTIYCSIKLFIEFINIFFEK